MHQVVSLVDEESLLVEDGALEWIPLRRRLGIRAFGTNAYRAASAGDLIVEDHHESSGQEEIYVVMTGGKLAAPGPLVAGRPVVWLALQALAVLTVVAAVMTGVRWRRIAATGERVRLGLVVAGGAVFLLWALYWGLLLP